jgi:uncharacterized membrane protein
MKNYDKWAKIFENLLGLSFGIWFVTIFVNECLHPIKYWLEISVVAVVLGLVFNWLSDRLKDKAKRGTGGKRK